MGITIRELAKIANVSPATVSIVLNGKRGVSEETRAHVLKIAEQHHYISNRKSAARQENILVMKYWSGGMLVEENQSFVSTIVDSAEEALGKAGYSMTTLTLRDSLTAGFRQIDFDEYCGIIVIATEITAEQYGVFKEIPLPFVIVDNTVPWYKCSSINVNNYDNVFLAMKYCADCGHNEIGYLRSKVETANFKERNVAFKSLTKELELNFKEEHEFGVTPTLYGAYQDLKKMLAGVLELPTCFFADNDTIAIGCIKALKERGFKVPDDVSVIGMDDIPFASVSSPALSTVKVQKELIGRQAVRQLIRIIGDGECEAMKIRVTGELVVRNSVKIMKS